MPSPPRNATALRTVLVGTIALSLTLNGCRQNVNLQAVADYAKTVTASDSAFQQIALDYAGTCYRTRNLQIANASPPVDCSGADKDATNWAALNEIVITYAKALGDLAGGNAASTDYGIPALADQIKTTTLFNDTQASAAKTFAKDAVNVILAGERQAALADGMQAADTALQQNVDTLKTLATQHYLVDLKVENGQMNSLFNQNLNAIHVRYGLGRLEALQYRDEWDRRKKLVSDRQGAVAAYVDELDIIAKTHHQFVTAVQSGSLADAIQASRASLQTIAIDLRTLYQAFKP